MASHKAVSGFELTLGKGGVRFKKKPSAYNVCIGNQLKGGRGPTEGGRYDKGWQAEFTKAAQACASKRLKSAV